MRCIFQSSLVLSFFYSVREISFFCFMPFSRDGRLIDDISSQIILEVDADISILEPLPTHPCTSTRGEQWIQFLAKFWSEIAPDACNEYRSVELSERLLIFFISRTHSRFKKHFLAPLRFQLLFRACSRFQQFSYITSRFFASLRDYEIFLAHLLYFKSFQTRLWDFSVSFAHLRILNIEIFFNIFNMDILKNFNILDKTFSRASLRFRYKRTLEIFKKFRQKRVCQKNSFFFQWHCLYFNYLHTLAMSIALKSDD